MSGKLTQQPVLSCRSVIKTFGEKTILDGIDLDLWPEKIMVLSGENGAGKTTLARILAGLEPPTTGEVRSPAGISLLFVPQDFVVWPHLSVKSNLEISYRGARRSRQARMDLLLNGFGLDGLDIRQKAGRLSFGQQHRLALARSLMFRPEVLLLDEPLAHADPEGVFQMSGFIGSIAKSEGIAILWISHGTELQGDVSRMELKDGRLN